MAVLADTEEDDVRLVLGQKLRVPLALGLRGVLSVEAVDRLERILVKDCSAQEVCKAGRMLLRKADILVHMEGDDLLPLDVLLLKLSEELVLRGSGGKDGDRLALLRDDLL